MQTCFHFETAIIESITTCEAHAGRLPLATAAAAHI